MGPHKRKKWRDPDAESSETTFVPDPTLNWWESPPVIFGCIDNYRLPKGLVMQLIENFKPIIKESSIPLHLKVSATLNFYASGSHQRSVGLDAFAIMIQTVELVQPQHRVQIASLLFACSSLSYLLLGVTAMFIPYWNTLLLVIFTPSLISIFYYWLIPESTKWLLMRGRTSDVNTIVQKIIKTNNIKISSEAKYAIELNPELLFQEAEKTITKPVHFCTVFNHPAMVVRVVLCSYCWITNIFIYYGMSLISVAIGGNKYTNFMAVQFIEIPACFFVMFISRRIGRKKILSASFFIAASALLIYTVIGDVHWARLSIYLIGKFTITVAFSILFVYTSEFMPTCLRQTLLSTCSAFGRIGSIIAPQVPLLEMFLKNSSMYLFSVTALLAGIVCLQFPETLNTELPDTIEEAIALGKSTSNIKKKIFINS